MAIRLKTYVCSLVLDTLKTRVGGCTVSPSSLSNHVRIGKIKNSTNIEFHLPVIALQKTVDPSLKHKINVSDMDKLSSNGIIHDVSERTFKNNTSIVFQINKNMFIKEVLEEITDDPILWKKTTAQNILPHPPEKKVIVEFSSPNIAKPFHMGHLRSTIVGNFISNLFEFLSCNVTRLNYLGDWGTQFGLVQVGLDICGYTEPMIKQNPMNLLYVAYVEANKQAEIDPQIAAKARNIFQSLENGSNEIMHKWSIFREYTVQELQNVYERLGVRFDEYNWESSYSAKDIGSVMQLLKSSGILKVDKEGRQVVEIDDETHVSVMKSDGSTLYLTRDIAAAIDRHEKYDFSQMLYIVDTAQSYHFTSLFGVLSKMKFPWASSLKHVKFGRIRGMSTRKGTVVFLDDILDECRDIMTIKQETSPTTKAVLGKSSEKINDILGISAVIINDLKQRRQKDYDFDWNRALQVQGDTGVKLQYTHCRLCNLEKNCGANLPVECDPIVFVEPEAILLVQDIARFDEILLRTYEELEACILANYLLRFCNVINRAFEVLRIKNEDKHVGSQRLLLFHASRIILNEGMKILGLNPLHEM